MADDDGLVPLKESGPTWRWIVGVLLSVLLILIGVVIGSVTERLNKAESRLEAQVSRSNSQDTRIELQNYRISADSSLILEIRRETREGFDEIKQLLRGRGRAQ